MLLGGHAKWLLFFPTLAIIAGAGAVGDNVVTYKCSDRPLYGLPRLDEAGVDDLATLQARGLVTSVDLVNVREVYTVCTVRL